MQINCIYLHLAYPWVNSKKINMNIRILFIKIFLSIYLVLLLPHIFEIPLSTITVGILISGLLFAVIAHQSKYKTLATLFIVLHMVLELPHMIEHIGHDGMGMVLGHGLHIIFDLVLLYTLSNSIKHFIFFVFVILLLIFTMNTFLLEVMKETKPFVLGGVLGCVGTHLLFKKLNKKLVIQDN
jgi:hypothetical protein